MIMIKARAIVDTNIAPPSTGRGLGSFRVEVCGELPHDFVKIYTIHAPNEDAAAREGLDRFVAEVTASLQES